MRSLNLALRASLVASSIAAAASLPAAAQPAPEAHRGLAARLQARLDSLRVVGRFPGATLGVVLADGTRLTLATGMSDTARRRAMRPDDLMPQGSVGKTYVAAVALQLMEEGRLELDAPVSRYLGERPWFRRLPNAADITVRQLMNHTSGLVRYEFDERFLTDLKRDPFRTWQVEEQLAYLFDRPAPFAAGQGWDYSDTNYLVLGLIIERLTGVPLNDAIRRRVIDRLGLEHTIPNDRPDLPIAQGYAGAGNGFLDGDAMVVNGRMILNPAFEGAGGGWSSTALDLAVWAKALYEGQVVPPARLEQALDGVPARLGPEVRYGLGVIIWPSPAGPVWGHSGFFPGYLTEMRYFPDGRFAIALQVNASVPRALGMPASRVMHEFAELVRADR